MTNLFKDAFAPLKPIIIADFEAYVTLTIKRYADTWDNMPKGRLAYDATWSFVRSFAVMSSDRADARPTGEIKAAWLRKNAEKNADALIANFAAKLEKKLGTLGDFKATFTRGADFTLSGTRNGHHVLVEQQTVFKVSPQGKPFHQFPARIYVDGKFVPANQYEAAVA